MTKKLKLLQAIKTWIVVYPTLLLLNASLGQIMEGWLMSARMFVMTIILVPMMVFILMPFIDKQFRKFQKN